MRKDREIQASRTNKPERFIQRSKQGEFKWQKSKKEKGKGREIHGTRKDKPDRLIERRKNGEKKRQKDPRKKNI